MTTTTTALILEALAVRLGVVSYHVRMLVQHFYRLTGEARA